jgi:hypothetical protein
MSMASSTAISTVLAALKGHAVAVAVASTVLVGGGAAAAAVATGKIQLPSQASSHATGTHTPGADATNGAAARQAACTQHNGDAGRLASVYAPLFTGDSKSAQDEICTLFVGSDGHAVGFGEVQQMLDIAAAIEAQSSPSTACLTTPLATATPGKPADAGKPSAAVPTQPSSGYTMGTVIPAIQTAATSTPLAQLAVGCGASRRPAPAGTGSDGSGQGQATPSARPTGTPGAKPTGTPGRP